MSLPGGFDKDLFTVSAQAFADESRAVAELLSLTNGFSERGREIHERASRYVQAVRKSGVKSGIEEFQHEYGLSSREGIMIMCLAEALLRIPDAATADALIHDKLSTGEWDRHIGFGRPWLTRAGALGLEIADAISDSDTLKASAGQFIGGLLHRMGEPVVRAALKAAMKTMGGAFVIGTTLKDAQKERRRGMLFSFDMLGEGARSKQQAEKYFTRYMDALESLKGQGGKQHARDGISIKLSALHPRFELRQWDMLQAELLPKLRELLALAANAWIPLTIDAEEATRLDVTLLCFKVLLESEENKDYEGLGIAVQAYQKRAPHVIDWLGNLARKTGKRIPVRLVKGAYWDGEIKRAQEAGLSGYPVFTAKAYTDVSYLACANKLLAEPALFYPQFATHNAHTITSILETAGEAEYEFQRLWGMGEALYSEVMKDAKRPCRIYAPIGEAKHLLSYLIRRILENGANSSFVRGLWDAPLDELLADPVKLAQDGKALKKIPLPEDILPGRVNSRGYDPGNLAQLDALWLVSVTGGAAPKDAAASDCMAALACAESAFLAWSGASAGKRADMLEQAASLFAENESELLALLIQEGKKTLSDSIAEVREAIDYCRYYAQTARQIFSASVLPGISGERNTLMPEPRGVFVAISPWNFPLAIFTGQIAAALATGNCVIAKPAEQTPKVAELAMRLMHKAGIPEDVLQLLCGGGEIGQALVSDPRCSGVAFTGSTETAWAINRALAARNAPIASLIAETGGQNCMIVDSSALIEQAVDDMVISAFGNAGQRCSALRVAFVQEDIADELLAVLSGAMAELRVGLPDALVTDIPPVIDREAYGMLIRHIEAMKKEAKLVAVSTLPVDAEKHLLVAPHAFEITSIAALAREVFGPVLHIVRWRAGELDNVIAQVNSTGYGLTFGIHSRIDERIREVSRKVKAGNIYVNRSMIGAAVGQQPFGGHGLSGTGPKAGGPHYLMRFCQERTLCINTAAVGGNLELLT